MRISSSFVARLGVTMSMILAAWIISAPAARADVTGVKIALDETITIDSKPVRHLKGAIVGKALRDEPSVPTLEHCAGLQYESDFELFFPLENANGRFWFSVLNRGNDTGKLRDGILARGSGYGWCEWQAKNIAAPKPLLKFSGFQGDLPQAYGLVVIRDFVVFLRSAPAPDATATNPLAGKIKFVFTYGHSQSARLMRSFLLLGLNSAPQGKVFDGFIPHGARAGYIDLFRADADPGSGGLFTAETVVPPYGWAEIMARANTDAKIFVINAETEYYNRMAYLLRRGGAPPQNVRIYDFPLSDHGGGGAVPYTQCLQPLAQAMEDWACNNVAPPDSRMFTLEKRESPRVKHLPAEPAEMPVLDDLGIPVGGVRLPPVAVPTARYVPGAKDSIKAEPLSKDELARRYGTAENYRKKVAEAIDQLIRDRFLPESAREKYTAAAEKIAW